MRTRASVSGVDMETSCRTTAHRRLFRDLSVFILCVEIRNATVVKKVGVKVVFV